MTISTFMKTKIIQNIGHENKKIFDVMSKSAKNVYNSCLYVDKFMRSNKYDIYKQLFCDIYKNNEIWTYNNYNDFIVSDIKRSLNKYSEQYENIKKDQQDIYEHILFFLNEKLLTSANFYVVYDELCKKYQSTYQKKALFDILKSMYIKKYYSFKYQIINNAELELKNNSYNELLNDVKLDNFLFNDSNVEYKKWINDLCYFKCAHFDYNINTKPLQKCYDTLKTCECDLINEVHTLKNPTKENLQKIQVICDVLYTSILKAKTYYNKNIICDDVLLNIINLKTSQSTDDLSKNLNKIIKTVLQILAQIKENIKNYDVMHHKGDYFYFKSLIFEKICDIRYNSIIGNDKNVLLKSKELCELLIKKDKANALEMINKLNDNKYKLRQVVNEYTNKIVLSVYGNIKHRSKIISEQNLIEQLMRYQLNINKLNESLPSDVINNIMKKIGDNVKSFYEKIKKKQKANYPNYLKTQKFILPYLAKYSMKVCNNKITIFTGKYVNSNYRQLRNDNIMKLTNGTDHSKYIHKKYLSTNKLQNSLKCDIEGNLMYINKKSDKIIDGGYVTFNIPKQTSKLCTNIKQIEIVPKFNSYNLHIKYEEEKQNHKAQKIDILKDSISIDLGVVNLMSIYNPTNSQHIIKGGEILSTNHYFNNKINMEKSKQKIENDSYMTKKISKLYIKRENKINGFFNDIVNKLFEIYATKKIFIIGYNKNWKYKCKLKQFVQIPYRKLINKIFEKGKKMGIEIVETNESYTSICDALKMEKIKKHDKYSGYRCSERKDMSGKKARGIFISGNGKAINSDINGAINIMRKYCEKKEIKMEKIEGKEIYNPKIIKINPRVRKRILDNRHTQPTFEKEVIYIKLI